MKSTEIKDATSEKTVSQFESRCRTICQIPKKCKETSNLMWLPLIWLVLFLFVCWNLFCTIANLRIKCVTETKTDSVLFYKHLKSSFLDVAHIWLWGFFTLLDALAHDVASPRCYHAIDLPAPKSWSPGLSYEGIICFFTTYGYCRILKKTGGKNTLSFW